MAAARNAAAASLDCAFFCPRIANMASGSSKVTAGTTRVGGKHVERLMQLGPEKDKLQLKVWLRQRPRTHEHGAAIGEGAASNHPGGDVLLFLRWLHTSVVDASLKSWASALSPSDGDLPLLEGVCSTAVCLSVKPRERGGPVFGCERGGV